MTHQPPRSRETYEKVATGLHVPVTTEVTPREWLRRAFEHAYVTGKFNVSEGGTLDGRSQRCRLLAEEMADEFLAQYRDITLSHQARTQSSSPAT